MDSRCSCSQSEILEVLAERSVAASDRPALVAGGALLEHLDGARWGRPVERRRCYDGVEDVPSEVDGVRDYGERPPVV